MISPFIGKFKVTSPMGNRVIYGKLDYHKGLDLVALENTTIHAIADGVIEATPYESKGFGYYVRQRLPNGKKIYYGHMAAHSIIVKPGDTVKAGDKLGKMGSTGMSTGPHTHIEIRYNGISENISEFTEIPNVKGEYYYLPNGNEEGAEEEMTQEQFNQMMNEYIRQTAEQGPSDWSQNARAWAEREGLIQGDFYGNKQYKKTATREELVQILYRFFSKIKGGQE